MNDMMKQSSALFTHSGCLSSEALMQFVAGYLAAADQQKADNHIQSCPLCADAADGLRLWQQDSAAKQTAASGTPAMPGTGAPELFTDRIKTLNSNIQQRVQAHKREEKSNSKGVIQKPLTWLAAAASVLLFITAGYILWMQQMDDKAMIAQQQRENIPNTVTAYGEMPSPPPAQVILTVKYTGKKGTHFPPVVSIDHDAPSATVAAGANITKGSSPVEDPEYAETKPGPESELYREEYGKHRSVRYTAVKNTGGATRQPDAEEEANAVFMNVQEMPSFPGGDAARKKYLARNLRYPNQAAEDGIQGTVYVSFVVKTNGSLSDIKIIKGIGGGCDQEALRVVKRMPAWNPGYQNGRKVAVLFNMPVYFRLQ